MDLGNVGDSNTLAWLFCDLQNYGKTLIRQGHREGLPIDGPNIWVFCPLIRNQFPRDRKLVKDCEKCSHYKGVSHSLKRGSTEKPEKPFSVNMIPVKKRLKTLKFEKLKEIEEKTKKDNEEWENEERRIFGKDSRMDKESNTSQTSRKHKTEKRTP